MSQTPPTLVGFSRRWQLSLLLKSVQRLKAVFSSRLSGVHMVLLLLHNPRSFCISPRSHSLLTSDASFDAQPQSLTYYSAGCIWALIFCAGGQHRLLQSR
jgi:hypothetical protein